MSVSKKIRELIKTGMAEDEAIAQALGVPKSSSGKKTPEVQPVHPSMADAFKFAKSTTKVKKRKGN